MVIKSSYYNLRVLIDLNTQSYMSTVVLNIDLQHSEICRHPSKQKCFKFQNGPSKNDIGGFCMTQETRRHQDQDLTRRQDFLINISKVMSKNFQISWPVGGAVPKFGTYPQIKVLMKYNKFHFNRSTFCQDMAYNLIWVDTVSFTSS